MMWVVVVLFATMQGDMYVFTEPTFDTREECMVALSDNTQRDKIIIKLIEDYNYSEKQISKNKKIKSDTI